MNSTIVLVRDQDVAITCGFCRCLLLTHDGLPNVDWYMKISSFEIKDVDGVDELTFLQGFEDI